MRFGIELKNAKRKIVGTADGRGLLEELAHLLEMADRVLAILLAGRCIKFKIRRGNAGPAVGRRAGMTARSRTAKARCITNFDDTTMYPVTKPVLAIPAPAMTTSRLSNPWCAQRTSRRPVSTHSPTP